tara:strand:- start:817 stop:1872 length:1056 start_codon:yes stop_codon:yes gene_type:complete
MPPHIEVSQGDTMEIEYTHVTAGNFGDDMNSWFWEKLSPGGWGGNFQHTLIGIGSLLGLDRDANRNWYVLGAGAGYQYPTNLSEMGHWNFLAVRGPLTALALGLPEDRAVTDTAILLSSIPEFQVVPENERGGIIFIPHHRATEYCNWEEICEAAGIGYIDPSSDSIEVINSIRKSSLVLSGAMHAAIIADTFRVKWVPITTSSSINHFKWMDWSMSMELPYVPVFVGPGSTEGKIRDLVFRYSWVSNNIPENKESALRYLKKRCRRSPIRTVWSSSIWRVGSLVESIMKTWPIRKTHTMMDERAKSLAIIGLKKASLSEGFLSNDGIFEDRLYKMKSGLKKILEIKSERE